MLDLTAGLNVGSQARDRAEAPSASNQPIQFGKKTAKNNRPSEASAEFGQELSAQQASPTKPSIPSKGFEEVPAPSGKWETIEARSAEPKLQTKEAVPEWPVAVKAAGEVDPLTRRSAMMAFIRKMEDELGISATDIVAAFSKLTAEELLAPPEESVGRVLDQMGLQGEDREKALLYFEEMLKKSASSNMAEYLKGSNQQISLEVMSKSEARKKQINDSVDRMSQSFFVSPASRQASVMGATAAGAAIAGAGVGAAAGGVGTSAQGQMLWSAQSPTSELGWANQGEQGLSQGFEGLTEANTTEAAGSLRPNSTSGQPLPQGFEGISSGETVSLKENAQATKTAPETPTSSNQGSGKVLAFGFGADPVVEALGETEAMTVPAETAEALGKIFDQTNVETTDTAKPTSEAAAGSVTAAFDSKEQRAEDGHQDLSGEAQGDTAQSLAGQTTQKVADQPAFMPLAPKMSENQEAQNVRNVVDQAQVMIRNGGGEMKVKLNPEGIGEVTLKVVSEGGRVNVEMIASNAETKRMLERGLGDLRETLASHKLNIDHVKVGSTEQTSKQMDQQLQDQQSRFAQQFMEDFRRENQAWRQGFVDMPGIRNYRSQTTDGSGMGGITPQQSSGKREGRRLDLVA